MCFSPNKNRDAELVGRAKQGGQDGEQAFEALMEFHRPCIDAKIAKMLWAPWSHEDRKDAYQETQACANKGLSTLEKDESFCYWVSSIAKHVCLGMVRKSTRNTPKGGLVQLSKGTVYSGPSPEDMASENQFKKYVHIMLERMPRDQRTVCILQYIYGEELDDIAKCLDVPLGTVKSRLNRGLNWCRKDPYAREIAKAYGLITELTELIDPTTFKVRHDVITDDVIVVISFLLVKTGFATVQIHQGEQSIYCLNDIELQSPFIENYPWNGNIGWKHTLQHGHYTIEVNAKDTLGNKQETLSWDIDLPSESKTLRLEVGSTKR